MQNFYEILDVDPAASEASVREAIARKRRSARTRANHPNAEKRHEGEYLLQRIAEAEKHLLTPETRAAYDAQLRDSSQQTSEASGEGTGTGGVVPQRNHEELLRRAEQMQREVERLREETQRKDRELQQLQEQQAAARSEPPRKENLPPMERESAREDQEQKQPREERREQHQQKGALQEPPQSRTESAQSPLPPQVQGKPWRVSYRLVPVLEARESDSQQLASAREILQQAASGHTREAIQKARSEYRSGRRDAALIQAYAWSLLYDIYRCTYGGFAGQNPYAATRSPMGIPVSSVQIALIRIRLRQLKGIRELRDGGYVEIEQMIQEVKTVIAYVRHRRNRLNFPGYF